MTDLPSRLKRLVELPAIEIEDPFAKDIYKGEEQENARLKPLLEKLIQCVAAASQIQDEIERSKRDCIGCANGNDLQDYDICRCCWRVYVNGRKYLIWDWKTTESRLEALTALEAEVSAMEGKK